MLRAQALRSISRRGKAVADVLRRSGAASFSSSAAKEALSSGRTAAAWGFCAAAAAGGVAVASSYGFAASPLAVAAQAEAPAPPAPAADADKPNPYALPTNGLKGLPKEVIVYQYEVCPFCCKVKAFLDFYNIPYRVVEVNPLTKAELKWSEYKKVPVVVLDGEQVNDSSTIISRLEAELQAAGRSSSQPSSSSSSGGLFGRSRKGSAAAPVPARAEEERWRRWVDDWFVRVITVNIYRNATEAFQTFDYIAEHGNFGWVQREAARVVGATMMWALSGRLKKKYHVDGDSRDNLYKSADEWVLGLHGKAFMGGDHPNLADLAMFGVIRAVTGTATFNDLMQHSKIGPWYERMFNKVGDSSRLSKV